MPVTVKATKVSAVLAMPGFAARPMRVLAALVMLAWASLVIQVVAEVAIARLFAND